MDHVFVDFDNKLVHELDYSEPGKRAVVKPYDLSGAVEILLQFYSDSKMLISLSSNSVSRIQVEDATNGRVSYLPNRSDFSSVSTYSIINGMRWVVRSSFDTRGIVFGDPPIKVTVIR